MKRLLPLLLLPVALVGIAATTYTITQLTLNSSPSDATLIEIYDPSASPKSGKYVLTNLARATPAGISSALGYSPQETIWTNHPSTTDDEGGTIYGSYTLSTNGNGAIDFAMNYLTNFYGDASAVVSIGWAPFDVMEVAKDNSQIVGVGDYPFNGATLHDSLELFSIGDANMTFSNIQVTDGVYAIGKLIFQSSTITNSSGLFGFGNSVGSHFSIFDDCRTVVGVGENVFDGATIKSSRDIYGFGGFASGVGMTNSYRVTALTPGAGDWPLAGQYTNVVFIGAGSTLGSTGKDLVVFGPDMAFVVGKTITAGGTTGNRTINKMAGSVNFAAAAQTVTVTDSIVTANSVIMATVATDDSTAKSCIAVPGSGSFILKLNAAATAETRVQFLIVN